MCAKNKKTEISTNFDLSLLSYGDIREAAKLLEAYAEAESRNELPGGFYAGEGVTLFIGNDGNVYIKNEEYQLLGLNEGKIDIMIFLDGLNDDIYLTDAIESAKNEDLAENDLETIFNNCDEEQKAEFIRNILTGSGNESEIHSFVINNDFSTEINDFLQSLEIDEEEIEKLCSMLQSFDDANFKLAKEMIKGM